MHRANAALVISNHPGRGPFPSATIVFLRLLTPASSSFEPSMSKNTTPNHPRGCGMASLTPPTPSLSGELPGDGRRSPPAKGGPEDETGDSRERTVTAVDPAACCRPNKRRKKDKWRHDLGARLLSESTGGDAHGPPPHLNPLVTFLPSRCRRWGLRYVFRSSFPAFGPLPSWSPFFEHPLADFGLAS